MKQTNNYKSSENPSRVRVHKKNRFLVIFGVCIALLLSGIAGGRELLARVGEVDLPKEEVGSVSVAESEADQIPLYDGEDYVVLNDNLPEFTEWDLNHISGMHFSELDDLGRCGPAYAMLDRSMMPTGERGDIHQIKPTGWKQEMYEGVVDADPPALYNRSHLIAYALSGENANEKNLITGTRYMNATTMLPWEEAVMRYLEDTDNHVLYRVTPLFADDELLARGVEMEAYSVEDKGKGICYHVFVYNVQPGVVLDYDTGESRLE